MQGWSGVEREVLFLGSLFGYLGILILLKWTAKFAHPGLAPSLLNGFIAMAIPVPGEIRSPSWSARAECRSGSFALSVLSW